MTVEIDDKMEKMFKEVATQLTNKFNQLSQELRDEYEDLVYNVICENVLVTNEYEKIECSREKIKDIKIQMKNTLKLLEYVGNVDNYDIIKKQVNELIQNDSSANTIINK